MRLKTIVSVLSVFIATTLVAGDLYKWIVDAERVIEKKYPTTLAQTSAKRDLAKIVNNEQLSDDEKIDLIKKKFFSGENVKITEDNAYLLVLKSDVNYRIHSIGMGYMLNEQIENIFTQTELEDGSVIIDQTADESRRDITTVQRGAEASAKIYGSAEAQWSWNPFKWKAEARAGMEAQAAASIAFEGSKTSANGWSRKAQASLKRNIEQYQKRVAKITAGQYFLEFAIDLKNNMEKDLEFATNSSIPVYINNRFIMNVRCNDTKTKMTIPAKNMNTFTFRGCIDNTIARSLLEQMAEYPLDIRVEAGQFFINTTDGSETNILQKIKNTETINIRAGQYEWKIKRQWNKKNVTLREALWAVNSIYTTDNQPFVFDSNGNLIKVFGKYFGKQKDLAITKDNFDIVVFKCGDSYSLSLDNLDRPFTSLDVLQLDENIKDNEKLKKEIYELFDYYVQQRNAWAQCGLGICYLYGLGVTQNYTQAVKWWKEAADQGYAEAQNNLGMCYYNGDGVTQDYTEAVKWWKKAAEQGYAEAQNNLGMCYYNGDGVTQDYTEAVKWYRKAAEQGFANAQNNLGWCYDNGYGVTQDYTEAVKWYRKAADQGFANAQNNLGFCYYNGNGVTKDYAEAVKWLKKAADQGFANVQCILGLCYANGYGVTKDYAEAVKWLKKAADQGFANAQCILGLFYEHGYGVTKDMTEAVKWYRKAAEQGYAEAQNNLGFCYYNGEGVTQDYTEAVKWYRKAAVQGFANAQNNLGWCYDNGYGVTQDYTEAVKWYRKAAEQGFAHAQNNLGFCYYNGEGVTKDDTEAVKWWKKAAEQGLKEAQNALRKLGETW